MRKNKQKTQLITQSNGQVDKGANGFIIFYYHPSIQIKSNCW